MGMCEGGENDPFSDLRTVDAGGSGEWDGGGRIDWGVGDVICASGAEMD